MASYYLAKVKLRHEDDNGKMKATVEQYLVDAINPTDVEAKITEEMKDYTQDWSLISVSESKIISVIA